MPLRARYALLVALTTTFTASAATAPEHFSPPIASLASSSDLIVIASASNLPASDGTVAVEIEEVWKGTAPTAAHVTASAPWMSVPWKPRRGERFLLFLQAAGPAQPYRLLDLGAAHFRVVPFSPPVVDVWPGLLPGTVLNGASCRLVGSLNPDGTVTYKKVCTGSYAAPLSTVREAVQFSSGAGVPPA